MATATELLLTPLSEVKGISPAWAELMAKLDLRSARDVLFNFPRRYLDLSDVRPIAELEPDKPFSVRGTVLDVDARETRRGAVVGVLITDNGQNLRGIWFNQPFMLRKFARGQQVMLSGKARKKAGLWEMSHPRVQVLEDAEDSSGAAILPIYSLSEGVGQGQVRYVTRAVLEQFGEVLEEVFPAEYLTQHNLLPIREAIPAIHFPVDNAALAAARRRLVYQELLILQLALAIKRAQQRHGVPAPMLEATARIDARIRRLLPFELTAGQEQAIREISGDLALSTPMSRLLEGDVGSGKTVVALYAMLVAAAHGQQAALMAPTEILARQHAATLERLLAASQVRRALLLGGMPAAQRAELLQEITAGEVQLVVGTQAILQEDVRFAKLGLVVIDEQHKFGVRQRATLRGGDAAPHYLVMSATPIPRSLAMTQFGDLDLSVIQDAPPGRQPVRTYWAKEEQRDKWWQFFTRKLNEGRQGYVIVPLVEESAASGLTSLNEAFESLANGPLEAFRLGLVHGRLNQAAKDAAIEAFRAGRTQVLIATSVVEVGVDVPNATLMTIEGADHFGLAQLHQLRGRISRGAFPGYCTAFTLSESDDVKERIEAFVSTTDGFRLAELDFALRGPGHLLGTQQSGVPPLLIADLERDREILNEARRDAQALIEHDPGLSDVNFARIRKMVLQRFGHALELADVG
ncbi:MAG: ATP-dependent DNA helicase RecG [Planctomycetia bacterium]|nr:ATP-dependent DNA helicase RecG [Planctomycetia bacterium]